MVIKYQIIHCDSPTPERFRASLTEPEITERLLQHCLYKLDRLRVVLTRILKDIIRVLFDGISVGISYGIIITTIIYDDKANSEYIWNIFRGNP